MHILAALSSLATTSVSQAASAADIDDGLTLAEVVQSLPTDPASLVALILLIGFVGSVVWFGTRAA